MKQPGSDVNHDPAQATVQRTILVIDDHASVRVSLEYILLAAGYRVLTAGSGAAAIALAQAEAIDGALIDVHMPLMNGFDTCIQLQGQSGALGRPLRIWFMTGAFTNDLTRRSSELGALGIFSKPSDLITLPDQLEKGFASPPPASPIVPVLTGIGNEPASDALP